jgi:hypothetical protein
MGQFKKPPCVDVPLEVVRIVAGYAPAAFVRVSRGPWACASLVYRVYMVWVVQTFMPRLSARCCMRNDPLSHLYWCGVHHHCGRWTRYFGTMNLQYYHANSFIFTMASTRAWVQSWSADLVDLLPREYIHERAVLRRLHHMCLAHPGAAGAYPARLMCRGTSMVS